MKDLLVRIELDPEPESAKLSSVMALAGVVSQGAIRFFANLAVGVQAGAAALGTFAACTSLAQFLSLLWPTTNGSAASRFVARSLGAGSPDTAAAVTLHLTKRTAQALIPLAAIGAVYGWVALDLSATTVLSVLLLLGGLASYALVRGLLFGLGRVTRSAFSDICSSVAAIAGLLALLAGGADTMALLLPMSLGYGAYAIANYPWSAARPALDRATAKEIDKFVGLAVAGSIASTGFLQLAMLVAKHFGGAAGAGQFAAALTLATPLSLVSSSIVLVLLPRMSRSQGQGGLASLQLLTDRANRIGSASLVLLFTPALILGPALSERFWPEEFSSVSSLIPMLLFAVLGNSLGIVCVNALTTRSLRSQRTMTLACYLGMFLGVGTWVATIPLLGVTGVAWGYLVGSASIALFAVVLEWRAAGHRWLGLYLKVGGVVSVQASVVALDQVVDVSLGARGLQSVALVVLFSLVFSRELRGTRPSSTELSPSLSGITNASATANHNEFEV